MDGDGLTVAVAGEVDVAGFEEAFAADGQRHFSFLCFLFLFVAIQYLECFRKVVLPVRSSLRAEFKAVALHLHEQDFIRPPGQVAVEEQDAGLDAGIGVEHAGGQADHGQR